MLVGAGFLDSCQVPWLPVLQKPKTHRKENTLSQRLLNQFFSYIELLDKSELQVSENQNTPQRIF